MSEFSESEVKQARLAQAILSLAADHKNDPEVLEHLSYICFKIKDALGQSYKSIDWAEMGDRFDMLEYNLRHGSQEKYQPTDTEKRIDRILFEADVTPKKTV